MLKEAEICASTTARFSQLNWPHDLFRVVIITSGRELNASQLDIIEKSSAEKLDEIINNRILCKAQLTQLEHLRSNARNCLADQQTTVGVIHQLLSDTETCLPVRLFIHVTTDGKDRSKADQLNYFLANLDTFLGGFEADDETLIGVFDADSRPDPDCLLSISIHPGNVKANVFQLAPLFNDNFIRGDLSFNNLYLGTRALFNKWFFLSHELPAMIASTRDTLLQTILSSSMQHLLGSGEFLRYKIIKQLNYFHPPSCDSFCGFLCSLSNIPIYPVPVMNLGQTPETFTARFYQGIVWFNGVMQVKKSITAHSQLSLPKVSWFKLMIMVIRKQHWDFEWWLYPYLTLACIIISASQKWYFELILALLGVLTYIAGGIIALGFLKKISALFRKYVPPIPTPTLLQQWLICFLFPIEKLVAGLSPLTFLVFKLFGKKVHLRKTMRASIKQVINQK